jgi:hypothetical protein
MKLHSGFAILDVKHGRKALAKKMPTGSNRLPDEERIPVTITGYISHQHGNDDGISIEPEWNIAGNESARKARNPANSAKAKEYVKRSWKTKRQRAAAGMYQYDR